MSIHLKIAIGIVLFGLVALIASKLLMPVFEDSRLQSSSDAKGTKGKLVVGSDSWMGYFPLCSPEMKKRLRRSGYLLECRDDSANYDERFKLLQSGELQFAVATIDSYLSGAGKYRFPGTVVAILDESKGGDAIVALKKKIKNLEALKSQTDFKVAYTPASPSEFLLKSMAVHFDVERLQGDKKAWAVETDGSSEALKLLQKGKVDIAVVWEPDVTRALSDSKFGKLLGTEDTNKLIVDILLVNRKFSQSDPDAVDSLLKSYFKTLKFYRDNPQKLSSDAMKYADVDEKQVKPMLQGVKWVNLTENALSWFGATLAGQNPEEGLADTIETTVQTLMDHGDFERSPLPNQDPYTIINSQFVQTLFKHNITSTQFGSQHTRQVNLDNSGDMGRDFEKISDADWDALQAVGSLKVRPIVFQSGSDELTPEGEMELKRAISNLKHYPNFRVLVKGHTGLRGDASANRILSQKRADSVTRYLVSHYGADIDRFRPVGLGSSQPLPQKPGESYRAYNYRLPRVELVLLAENI